MFPVLGSEELQIVHRLRKAGHSAMYAGGYVRDKLLGIPPKDIDIVTSAAPEEVSKLFLHVLEEGQQYGVSFICDFGRKIDVATLRREVGHSDGRRPDSVEFTTDYREDAARRDFTINSLFMNPDDGEIVDYFGGRDDIKQRRVVAVGDPNERIQEDYLRMLRAIRFAARFDFIMDPDLYEAIERHSHKIQTISPERIRDEVFQILRCKSGLRYLVDTGLSKYIFLRKFPDGVEHVISSLITTPNPITDGMLLAALFHEATQWEIKSLADRLRMDNDNAHQAIAIVGDLPKCRAFKTMRVFEGIGFMRTPCLEDTFSVQASVDGDYSNKAAYYDASHTHRPMIRSSPLVTGKKLITWGHKPGEEFARTIKLCRKLQDAGVFSTEEDFRIFLEVVHGGD